jgi:Rv2525c-like, glycoside hydrolase-like domain
MQCVRVPTAVPAARTAAGGARPAVTAGAVRSRVYKYGIDFGWSSVSAQTAWNIGARFGASYLSTAPSKNWTWAMLNSYHARGMGTVAVWETTATRALSGHTAGRFDARSALSEERALGIPTSRPVYFAVDFDETPSQAHVVALYFQGADSVLGASRVGAYGGYWAVARLFDARLIRYGWQCSVWSGGYWDPRAQIQQYAYGSAYDWDAAMTADYGQAL